VAGAAAAVTPISLGLVIGTNTQAYSAKLGTFSALADAAGWLHSDGAGVYAWSTPTAANVGALPIGGGTLTGNLLFTDATYDIGVSGATRPRDIFASRNASFAGSVGIGVVAVSNYGLNIRSSLNAAASVGCLIAPVFGSSVTAGAAFEYWVQTAAAAFTLTDAYATYIASPALGAGSAITNLYGTYWAAQTGATTLNYVWYAATTTSASSLTQAGLLTARSIVATTGFGCNGKAAQTAYASGGAAAAAGTATLAGYGFLSAAEFNTFISTVNAAINVHRSALVANGIES
jgi:hypothetical protein